MAFFSKGQPNQDRFWNKWNDGLAFRVIGVYPASLSISLIWSDNNDMEISLFAIGIRLPQIEVSKGVEHYLVPFPESGMDDELIAYFQELSDFNIEVSKLDLPVLRIVQCSHLDFSGRCSKYTNLEENVFCSEHQRE